MNKNNAVRQLHVNAVANHIGTGSGTAFRDGVPGTPLGVTGHDRYSYGHGRGYGGYGNRGYGGYGGYGANNYGGFGGHYGGHGNYGGYGGHGYGFGNFGGY